MNTTDVLRGAKELLSDEGRWCKGWFSRNADGSMAMEDEGVSYCILGAFYRVSGTDWWDAHQAVQSVVGRMPQDFNDDAATTHADLIAAFDRALLLVAGDTPVEENVGEELPVAA